MIQSIVLPGRFPTTFYAYPEFNLLDRKASDIEYFYETRLRGEAINPDPALNGGYNDIHLHPAEPVSLRVVLTGKF